MLRVLNGRASLLVTALLAAGTAAAADAPAPPRHAGGDSRMTAPTSGGDSASKQLQQAMAQGMDEMNAMRLTGDADRDFAMMMAHHHAQAVKMAQAYLAGAKDARLRAWAQKSLGSAEGAPGAPQP